MCVVFSSFFSCGAQLLELFIEHEQIIEQRIQIVSHMGTFYYLQFYFQNGRPPTNEIPPVIQNEAYNPTLGSTPAIIENAIASGISARPTTSPASTSPRMLENHCSRIFENMRIALFFRILGRLVT